MNQMTLTEAFALFVTNNPRPFTEGDWNAFAGCDGEPYIAENDTHFAILDVGTEETVLQVYNNVTNEDEMEDFTMIASFQLDWNPEVTA